MAKVISIVKEGVGMDTISNKFSLPALIRFSMPAIFMLILTSIYTSVDGVFVSRFVGNDALSAINIVLPLDNIMCGIAIMFGTGGSAIIGRKLVKKTGGSKRKLFVSNNISHSHRKFVYFNYNLLYDAHFTVSWSQ